MPVKLEGVKFNYDEDLKKTGAFNIRRNETQTVRIPEWQPDQSSDFTASPAVYAICHLPQDLTIQASFLCEGALQSPLMIRAVAESPDHILGDVKPTQIPAQGSSGFVTLDLPDARIKCAGVGIHDITWRWQFSVQPELWTDFQITRHRIYTVLAQPSEPWEPKSRDDSNIHQPWTEVLDRACQWAAGASCDLDEAATLITREFFNLVSRLAGYKGGASYAFAKFKCTEFLSLLSTGTGGNQALNCDDCATVVSTFANVLGCQLSQSSMGEFFDTNPVVLIGNRTFDDTDFIYHAVAWKGMCEAHDELFDGCLQIDEDLAPPFIPLQPTDIPFGDENEGYRFSLVREAPHVQPIPNHMDYGRRRRKLGTGYPSDQGISDPDLLEKLKKFYEFDSWPKAEERDLMIGKPEKTLFSFLKETFLAEWSFHSGNFFQDNRFPNVFDGLFKSADFSPGKLLSVTVYECKDTSDPNLKLLEILGRFEQPDFKRLFTPEIGNLALMNGDGTTVVFRRGQFLGLVRSAGRKQLPIIDSAQHLDRFLTEQAPPD